MYRKHPVLIPLALCIGNLMAVEAQLPAGSGTIAVPPGWDSADGRVLVLRAPARDAMEAPRLAVSIADGDTDSALGSLRDGYRRMADGCEILDDDQVPLGGRVWRRLRVRFATGPVAFGQSAWVGTVGTRTVVAVLSAPDERIAGSLAAASAAVASISAPR